MIVCRQEDWRQYIGLSDELDDALRSVAKGEYRLFVQGKNVISGDRLFANRFDYDTMDADSLLFESHRDYADLHVILSGAELIQLAPESALEEAEREEASDYIGLRGAAQTSVELRPGDLLIAFPGEAHKVKATGCAGPSHVQKAVYKILMKH